MAQIKRDAVPNFFFGIQAPQVDMQRPWSGGDVANDDRAVPLGDPKEAKKFGSGKPKMERYATHRAGVPKPVNSEFETFPTPIGDIALPKKRALSAGFLPTAGVIEFLRSEYVGSSQPQPRQRFY